MLPDRTEQTSEVSKDFGSLSIPTDQAFLEKCLDASIQCRQLIENFVLASIELFQQFGLIHAGVRRLV